jgi:trans-2,3-dihydro-3-hydroxyanthranilate isomerase
MRYEFEQVDVFTDKRFAGNPLAVFTDAKGLTREQMQLIAREMNLSETTFVVAPERAECVAHYYIFTPGRELPFAGHPTIGTAYVLARSGRLPQGTRSFNMEAQVGAVPLRIEGPLENPSAFFFQSPEVIFGPTYEDRAGIARALNVQENDLLAGAPLQQTGCPVFHLNVGLRTPALVDQVVMNSSALAQVTGSGDCDGVYVFAPSGANHFYTRLLCFENTGIVEDPATGSAAGPLGAYLVRHGLASGEDDLDLLIEQGVKMHRQSFLNVKIQRSGPQVKRLEVGGSAVAVLKGTLEI